MKHLYIITAFLFCCLSIIAQEQTKKKVQLPFQVQYSMNSMPLIPGANVF